MSNKGNKSTETVHRPQRTFLHRKPYFYRFWVLMEADTTKKGLNLIQAFFS